MICHSSPLIDEKLPRSDLSSSRDAIAKELDAAAADAQTAVGKLKKLERPPRPEERRPTSPSEYASSRTQSSSRPPPHLTQNEPQPRLSSSPAAVFAVPSQNPAAKSLPDVREEAPRRGGCGRPRLQL